MLKVAFIFIFLNTSLSFGQGQNHLASPVWERGELEDSIRFNALLDYYIANTFSIPDSVLVITNFHIGLAQEKGNPSELIKALNEKSLAYQIKGNLDSTLFFLRISIDIAESIRDEEALAVQTANIASVYRSQNQYVKAIKFFNQSLKILKGEKNKFRQAHIINNIGLIYTDIGDYYSAELKFNEALAVYKEIGVENETADIWANLAAIYFENGSYRKSVEYLKRSIEISEFNGNDYITAQSYNAIGNSYSKLNQLDSAFFYARKSLKINLRLENEVKVIYNRLLIAQLTYLKNPLASLKLAESLLIELDNYDLKTSKASLYFLLYNCYKEQNNYELSLEMYEKHADLKDSLKIEANKFMVIREALDAEHQEELYKNKLASELEKSNLEITQLKRTYLIVFVFLVFLSLIVFYARNRFVKNRLIRTKLLQELEILKKNAEKVALIAPSKFDLDRHKIEKFIERTINETDWIVLKILLEDPVISNKEIAEKSFMSVAGIGSSLRRMYDYFEIKESKYKKISLLLEAIKISNRTN